MKTMKKAFIELALKHDVLRFGQFTLKSGRISPYFFNAGNFFTGEALAKLGVFYTQAISQSGVHYDALFGPAYKGIPLVSTVACALYNELGKNTPWSFNRKEAKDHGEGGMVVGAPLKGRILLIDDVMTAGTAMRESIALIQKEGAQPSAICVMLDRQEQGLTAQSALQEIKHQYDIETFSLITLTDLINYLDDSSDYRSYLDKLNAYKKQYGV